MTDKIVAFTTCGDAESAAKLARALVGQKLAACVNIIPAVRSIYAWQGKIEDDAETLLLIKSRRGLVEDLRATIEREHAYDVPEFVVVSVDDGLPTYLRWIEESTARVEG